MWARGNGTKRSLGMATLALLLLALFATVSWGAPESAYLQGLRFGSQYRVQVAANVEAMKATGEARGVDYAQVLSVARERETLAKDVLPQKISWMRGVAEGAGVAYEDLLVYNTADRMMTGFVGECTTFIAHGKALAAGKGSLISKNRDLGANVISEVARQEGGTHEGDAIYQAAYIDIPQVGRTYTFVGSRSAGRWGYGMGVNEHQVLVSDNDAPTRDELAFDKGLHDNDYVRLVLERAKTAREGVEILTKLTEQFGQAWNSIMFEIGDPNELWIVEISGKRWVARRCQDSYTARSNQFQITDDYELAAADLIPFALSKGWISGDVKTINFRAVYGGTTLYPDDNNNLETRPSAEILYNTEMRYLRAMELLKGIEGKISPQTILPLARDHYDTYTLPSGKVLELKQVPFYSTKYVDDLQEWRLDFPEKDTVEIPVFPRPICHHAFEGITASTAVLVARPEVPNALGLMLHAHCQPCNSLYVPFYVGASAVDSRFESPEAGSRFMLISKMAFGAYGLYHDQIRAVFDPYEASLFAEMPSMEKQYGELLAAGKADEAQVWLDEFSSKRWNEAYELAGSALQRMIDTAASKSAWKKR